MLSQTFISIQIIFIQKTNTFIVFHIHIADSVLQSSLTSIYSDNFIKLLTVKL